ncbi:MAG: Rrf2 family transcriptional regulator [Deltaproteobacteria bacterium]|nr:Rrf2 family transcriptional regulator [Deltaproteobacteria bacterium]
MRITQWGEYGVLLSLYLAKRNQERPLVAAQDVCVTATEIAENQDIALQYAQQILHRLRRGNVVTSTRGPHGGYKLARSPSEITLYDILLAVEGETFELICSTKPLDPKLRCAPHSSCWLRPVWNDLKEHLNAFLKNYTLDKLLDKSDSSTSLKVLSCCE